MDGSQHEVPAGLRAAAIWALCLLVLGGFTIAVFMLLSYFSAVAVPIAIALLLAALLTPTVRLFRRWGWSHLLASVVALLGMLVLVVGVITLVGAQAVAEAPALVDQSTSGAQQFLDWLSKGPLGISLGEVNGYLDQLQGWVQSQGANLAAWAAGLGTSIGNFLAGVATALIAAFFFVYSGRRMWDAIASWVIPGRYETRVTTAAAQGWNSLVSYMRATVIVCLVDATGITLVAAFLGVPMPVALFALTFIASFIPIVGAFVAGTVAVALALVTHGPVAALIMGGGVLMVNMIEGNVLQPFLLGKSVSLHPLATVLGLTAGATVSGILGALLAIPLMAFVAAFARALRNPEAVPTSTELPARAPEDEGTRPVDPPGTGSTRLP